jgi:hypothetical protein
MMDDEHGNVMPTLQFAQVGEQRGDLAAGVLVDAVETYERIEDGQARLQSGSDIKKPNARSVPGHSLSPEVLEPVRRQRRVERRAGGHRWPSQAKPGGARDACTLCIAATNDLAQDRIGERGC